MRSRSMLRVVLMVAVALMASGCDAGAGTERRVAVASASGPLEAPRMTVPLRPRACSETAQTFGFSPEQACSGESLSMFVWLSFSRPTCFAEAPVRLSAVRPDQAELPDRLLVVDLQTSEGCADPLETVTAMVELQDDEFVRGGHTAAVVGRLAVDGSVAGAPMLLVSDVRGDSLLPLEVPFTHDSDTPE